MENLNAETPKLKSIVLKLKQNFGPKIKTIRFLMDAYILIQQVFGARPAANVTWYNNTTPLRIDEPHSDRIEINEKTVRNLKLIEQTQLLPSKFNEMEINQMFSNEIDFYQKLCVIFANYAITK